MKFGKPFYWKKMKSYAVRDSNGRVRLIEDVKSADRRYRKTRTAVREAYRTGKRAVIVYKTAKRFVRRK